MLLSCTNRWEVKQDTIDAAEAEAAAGVLGGLACIPGSTYSFWQNVNPLFSVVSVFVTTSIDDLKVHSSI